ncbi:MAG: hypothetical protein IPM39_23290 [Chloroflexi bacterium]|nr:hypothetical protein [Chloroflexota bacterium]
MYSNLQLTHEAYQQAMGAQTANINAMRDRLIRTFWRLRAASQRQRFWERLTGRPSLLLDLNEEKAKTAVTTRHHEGIQTISLNRIVGSEGRQNDFDANFRPRQANGRDRWVSVALMRALGKSLPPVSLVLLGDAYFVRDGHHRISVARARGELDIEAEVIRWQTA